MDTTSHNYDLENGPEHPYHLVNPSAWPIVSAFAAGLLAICAVMYMHNVELFGIPVGLKGVIIGFIAVLACMFFWWKDVIHESVKERAHTKVAKIGFRYGMTLFIASEVMFFFAFFWALFNGALYPTEAIGGMWPPADIEAIPAFDLPFLYSGANLNLPLIRECGLSVLLPNRHFGHDHKTVASGISLLCR